MNDTSEFALAGRVAVVTGGAGAIGAASARRLAARGAHIVIADHARDRAEALAAELATTGGSATVVAVDLTTADGMAELVAATPQGRADVLVNALGEHLDTAGAFESSTEAQWQALYEVNLLSVFRTCHAFLPGMRARGWGRIVNFSSVEGIRSAPGLSVYSAFKRAIDAFTKSVAVDVAVDGVLVNAIAVDKTRSYQVGHYELPAEYERHVPTWIPAGRYAEADDIAKIVEFLGTDQNSWVVGQTIVADGGTLSAGGWFRTPERWTNQPLLVQHFEDPATAPDRPPSLR